MALKRLSTPSEASTFPQDNLTPGEYEMRLVYVADLGIQTGMTWKGQKKKDSQQICLGLEVVGETTTINDEEVPRILWSKPFNIFKNMTELGNELKMYRLFEPSAKEGDTPDWDAQLGKPCVGSVVAVEKEDKTFDNIGTLSPLPAKYHDGVAENQTQPCVGDSTDPDNACNKALFGLAKWCFDNRVGAPVPPVPSNTSEDDTEVPVADEVPY